MNQKIPINEIIFTLSGEVGPVPAGTLILLVRVMGCNLRCSYCDTPKTQQVGEGSCEQYAPEKLALHLATLLGAHKNVSTVLITGGEPLLYSSLLRNMQTWLGEIATGLRFVVETNGTYSVLSWAESSNSTSFVVDVKLEHYRNLSVGDKEAFVSQYRELMEAARKYRHTSDRMSPFYLKMPVCSIKEFVEGMALLREMMPSRLEEDRFPVFFSPVVTNYADPKRRLSELTGLVHTMQKLLLSPSVRFDIPPKAFLFGVNVQLHKLLMFP